MLDRTDNIPHLINMKVLVKVKYKSPTIAAPFTKECYKRSGSHWFMLIITIIIAGERLEACTEHSSSDVQRGEDEEDVWHYERHCWVTTILSFLSSFCLILCELHVKILSSYTVTCSYYLALPSWPQPPPARWSSCWAKRLRRRSTSTSTRFSRGWL